MFPDDIEVQVFSTSTGATLVAAIELVSPGNKDRPETRGAFAAKCVSYLTRGIGLIVVDIVTNRLANLHNEVMTLLGQGAPFLLEPAATTYAVDNGHSHLGFIANQSGGDFEGQFDRFTAQIAFAENDLAGSHFDVQVDTASVSTGDDERDSALRSSDLFDVEHYPRAHFVSTRFTRKAAGQYEAAGKLTIRDVTRDVVVPFSFASGNEGGKPVATLKGGVTLNRLDYGVGQGDWQDTTMVANEVRVKFDLRLTPAAAPATEKSAQSRAALH